MRKSLLALCAVLLLPLLVGCGGKGADSADLKTTAPVNNNAPEAKGAPVAPTDPSIVYPGGAGKGKRGH
jgi:hypothetical protein